MLSFYFPQKIIFYMVSLYCIVSKSILTKIKKECKVLLSNFQIISNRAFLKQEPAKTSITAGCYLMKLLLSFRNKGKLGFDNQAQILRQLQLLTLSGIDYSSINFTRKHSFAGI